MLNWFKKIFKDDSKQQKPVKLEMKPFMLSPKETLAWIAAQEGNQEILGWLRLNRADIYHAINAIKLEDKSRKWLTENGFPHVMAFIHAAEGDAKAQSWLNRFELLEFYHMALAIEEEDESWQWLRLNSTEDIFLLTKSIKKIKDAIEFNHNDIHSINKDI